MKVISLFYKYTGFLAIAVIAGSLYAILFDPDYGQLALSTDADSFNIKEGEQLYAKYNCASCHGLHGSQPIDNSYPKLNGQNDLYLKEQILAIKTGTRSNGKSALMKDSIAQLTQQEIEKISAYLSAQ